MNLHFKQRIFPSIFEGDTIFPEIDLAVWKEISREEHTADEKNKYDYAFVKYLRRD